MINSVKHQVLIGLVAIVFLPCSVVADAVGQWMLDEAPGAMTAADTVAGNDGTLNGSATFAPDGIVGNCVNVTIAGNGFVDIGDFHPFATGDFSVVGWVRTTPGDTTGDYFIVGKHRSGISAGYLVGINANGPHGASDKAWFYHSSSPGNSPTSTTTVNDGEWHQIVGVQRSGVWARIYVDGDPHEDQEAPSAMGFNDAHLALGAIEFGASLQSVFNGWIDEVQLYDHVLTPRQIQFLFENPQATVIGGLGDMNCDGVVSVSDIGSFVLALTNPAGYAAQFPDCNINHADMNMDGVVSVSDIGEFVFVLTDG